MTIHSRRECLRRSPCLIALAATLSSACGGTAAADATDSGSNAETSTGGSSKDDAAASSGGARPGTGGATGSGGVTAPGPVSASGGTTPTDASPGGSECPLRESGTVLTEADCHLCLPPGTTCTGTGPAIDAEGCVNVVRMKTTLWCEWYADGDAFDKPWGAVVTCQSNPGRVVCGGGI